MLANKALCSYEKKVSLTILIFILLLSPCTPGFNPNLNLETLEMASKNFGFVLKAAQSESQFGRTVSTAGDVDGDGFADVLIATPIDSSNRGIVYVVYGGATSSFSDIDLRSSPLDPKKTGFSIIGAASGGYLGWSASTAGDVNNDGFDDIIVGAWGEETYKGAAYLIYGGPRPSRQDLSLGSITLDPLETGFTIKGSSSYDYLGQSVGTAGDMNNDGFSDIIIGAPGKDGGKGAAYVIYGGVKTSLPNIQISATTTATFDPTMTGFVITGESSGDQLGSTVSMAGNVDNDLYGDIIIGAPSKNSKQGKVYVVYGRAKGSTTNLALSSGLDPLNTGFSIVGDLADDYFGASISSAGDIHQDGFDDVMIGAYGKNSKTGAAYVIYGGPRSSFSISILNSASLDPTSTGFIMTGDMSAEEFGWSVSGGGDVNKDGYADLLVGAYRHNAGRGAVYVIYGRDKTKLLNMPFSSLALDPETTGFMITGSGINANYGFSVSNAGDIDNNGFDDIVAGAYNEERRGFAYVLTNVCPISYCSSCISKVCQACDARYALSNSICESCPTKCKTCTNPALCEVCETGFLLKDNQCSTDTGTGCSSAQFPLNGGCQNCPTYCNSCSSLRSCSSCLAGFGKLNGICARCTANCKQCNIASTCLECNNLYYLHQSQCVEACPDSTFISGDNCAACPIGCFSCTSLESCHACEQGYTLSNYKCSIELSISESKGTEAAATRQVSSSLTGIGSVLCVGNPLFPLSALVSKIVQNTRYLDLPVTEELAEIYQTWDTDLISWEFPDSLSKFDHFEESPGVFARYALNSPFLVNFWPTLMTIGIGLTVLAVCFALRYFIERAKYQGWFFIVLQKLVAGSLNFAIIQAYACLDDILFYLILDVKTNPFNSIFSWISFLLALAFLCLGCLLILANLLIVRKYQRLRKEALAKNHFKDIEIFNQNNKNWELFYSEFNDTDLWSQSFLALQVVRGSLSSLIIASFYGVPLAQTLSLIIIDGTMIFFLYRKKPLITLRAKLSQYYFETITLLVHLCTFSLSILGQNKKPSGTLNSIFSACIIYLNIILVIGSVGFMFIEIYKVISQRAKSLKQNQSEEVGIQTMTEENSDVIQNIVSTETTDLITNTTQSPDLRKFRGKINRLAPLEDLHLLPGTRQMHNISFTGLNLQPSEHLNSRMNHENSSLFVDFDASIQVDQSIAPIITRRNPRHFKKRQPKWQPDQKNQEF